VSPRRPTYAPLALVATVAAVLGAAVPAFAASAPEDRGAPRDAPRGTGPWATVNVCDTIGHPDGIGIRGSMPGTGERADELFMRVQVQYLRRGDSTWRGLGRGADSGFVDVGNGAARARQAGRTFTVSPPTAREPAFQLRGLVTFEWRRSGVVQRRARRATTAGHGDVVGADPPGFSAATCSIR
jgi:hypothetical protein